MVGGRGSPLSQAQTMTIMRALESAHPGLTANFVAIRTSGDNHVLDSPISAESKGVFVKEIEEALISGQIDLAVHSAKDLPYELPEGLMLGPSPERAPSGDLLCSFDHDFDDPEASFERLPKGSTVMTSSVRRKAFLLASRPDLEIKPVRGNVATRLGKARDAKASTIIAAAAASRIAGLDLGRHSIMPFQILPPAPGQGALALEHRAGDDRVAGLLKPLGHQPTTLALTAERALARRLGYGCQIPVAALAICEDGHVTLRVALASPDGRKTHRISFRGPAATESEAFAIGREAAEKLLKDLEAMAQDNPLSALDFTP